MYLPQFARSIKQVAEHVFWGSVGLKLVISRRQLKMMVVREMIPCQQVNERVHCNSFQHSNCSYAGNKEHAGFKIHSWLLLIATAKEARLHGHGRKGKLRAEVL